MRLFIYLFTVSILLLSCEEVIQLDLDSMETKYVIEADLNNLSAEQSIRISQSVAFDEEVNAKPVTNAVVFVSDSRGRLFKFDYNPEAQRYINSNFAAQEHLIYRLKVTIGDNEFSAQAKMPSYVPVDSIRIAEDKILKDTYYSIVMKFNDPAGVENYYKYDISINQNPFKFISVFSDKYNDGLNVSHTITNRKNTIAYGDEVLVRRQCIEKATYTFWQEVQKANPGNAAPTNPVSNISNGALGYFSVSSAMDYNVKISMDSLN
ncbi:DUF4249 domain-containing protein [Sphingobacterium sp. Mn56C]|uniref:DUF4249 domain-containing protein n=1 Tax=Sphingobacterium sp. Mn56C TaxID=3395261 RepID=UPI003BCE85DC